METNWEKREAAIPPLGKGRLTFLRILGWPIFIFELALFALGIDHLIGHLGLWPEYVISLSIILAVFQGLAWLIPRLVSIEAEVDPDEDRWRVGRYSEKEIRNLAKEVLDCLPINIGRIRIIVPEEKSSNAWTFLSGVISPFGCRKMVFLTAGSLHYLEPAELQAVLLHEVGHHLRQNRIDVPGGWLAFDLACHGLLFSTSLISSVFFRFMLLYFALRLALGGLVLFFLHEIRHYIEYRCDLFSASVLGSPPVINALLKLGEEQELTEIVHVRVARSLLKTGWDDFEDLDVAFNEVRPYGRIFHDNLFKHAAEVTKEILGEEEVRFDIPTKEVYQNSEAGQFLAQRKKQRRPRIRWRRFDGDGDGVLSPQEIVSLCQALQEHPDHALVTSMDEYRTTTHPPFRHRVLVLNHYYPADRGA